MNWKPSRETLTAERKQLVGFAIGNLFDTLEQAGGDHRAGVTTALAAIEAREAPNYVLHPFFWQWCYLVRDAQLESAATELAALVDELPQVIASIAASLARRKRNLDRYGVPFDLTGEPRRCPLTLSRMQEMCRVASGGRNGHIDIVRIPDYSTINSLQRAIGILRVQWPQMADEISTNVVVLNFFRGKAAIGATDVQSHGAIFIKVEHAQNPVQLAEEIVHEASHTRLNTAFMVEPLITNDPEAKYKTPLRPDLRPMIGLFHQLYVLARLSSYYRRLPPQLIEHPQAVTDIGKQLAAALRVVEDNAELTARGRMLVDSIGKPYRDAKREDRATL